MPQKLFPTMGINYFRRLFFGVKIKLTDLLRDGLSPQKLALALAAGIIFGSFPLLIPGITTLLCVSFALAFRLNVGLIQVVNLACTPLQLIFYLPFLKAGKVLFQIPVDISWGHLIARFKEDFTGTLQQMGMLNLAGIAAWLVFAGTIGFLVYYFSLSLILNLRLTRNQ